MTYPHRCRLSRVIFKDGRELRVLHKSYDMHGALMKDTKAAISAMPEMIGYVLVTFAPENGHGCYYDFERPLHPRSMPEITRSVLEHYLNKNTRAR